MIIIYIIIGFILGCLTFYYISEYGRKIRVKFIKEQKASFLEDDLYDEGNTFDDYDIFNSHLKIIPKDTDLEREKI